MRHPVTQCICRPSGHSRTRRATYATALHELTHWTKPKQRLDRDFSAKRFGDHGYAREELVAELGAAFLCAELGITPEVRQDHADYLGHWLTILKEDKRAIFSAAAHAHAPPTIWAACSQRRKAQPRKKEGRGAATHPHFLAAGAPPRSPRGVTNPFGPA
jgi:antirestriction protein ArdC